MRIKNLISLLLIITFISNSCGNKKTHEQQSSAESDTIAKFKNKKNMVRTFLLFILSIFILTSCNGNSSNIYIIADTSTPDESVEYEFCKETGQDNYPITNYEKK